jgi:hypothetical protein
MAVKTFTQGEVLTTADTNTYLTNGGLVYITQSTLSATTNLNNIFTSTYDAYRLVITTNTFGGGAANIYCQLTANGTPNTTAANYAWVGNEQYTTAFAMVTFGADGLNAFWTIGRVDATRQQGSAVVDVFNPQATQFTSYQAYYTDAITFGRTGGVLKVNTSYDGVRLYINGTPSWTGFVRVYGYRQA